MKCHWRGTQPNRRAHVGPTQTEADRDAPPLLLTKLPAREAPRSRAFGRAAWRRILMRGAPSFESEAPSPPARVPRRPRGRRADRPNAGHVNLRHPIEKRLPRTLQRGGAAEEVALAVGNPEPLERFELFTRLDALGDDLATKLAGDGVEGAQEFLAWWVGVDPANEGHVDLDEVGREFHHGLEAAVGDARVVEGDLEAEVFVVVAGFAEDREVVDRFPFGDFEDHVFRPKREILQRLLKDLAAEGRVVNRRREAVQEELLAGLEATGAAECGASTEAVEFEDESRFFGELEELTRGVEFAFPGAAHQGFMAEDFAGRDVDDRLVENRDVFGEHEILKDPMSIATFDRSVQRSVTAGLFERLEDLALRTETGIVENRRMSDRQDRGIAVVGVDDLMTVRRDVLVEATGQLGEAFPVKAVIAAGALKEDREFIGTGRAAYYEVVLGQVLATGLLDQLAEHVRRLAMGLDAVASFDALKGRAIDQDHTERAVAGVRSTDLRDAFAEMRGLDRGIIAGGSFFLRHGGSIGVPDG